jgi:phage head morphogenesis protein, SPP1 gp7 family|nr:MAG TPA: portal [Caudoviricetes sp.]
MDFIKATASKLVKEIISLGSSSVSGELTDDLVKRMLKDMDIKSAIELMNESVISREWMIETDDLEYKEQALEIQKRFNNMNMSRILKDMLKAEVKKKSIFEISFENMAIKDLVLLPNKYISYDKEVGWKIKTRDSEIILENENNRFLTCINNGSIENVQGESELEPLIKPFLAKENLENKLNAIIEKYGDIITVFAYEPPLETASKEEKDKRYSSVEEQAKQLKEAKGKDVLAVPASGEKPLSNFVEFIKLDDLKPEIYLQLQEAKEKAIQKYIIGSTLVTGVDGNSGNRALGEVHNEQKELKINAKIKKIRDWFQKLIEIDAELYGYDSRNFYFKFVKELDEKETLELETNKTKIFSDKVNYIVKIVESGYTFTKEKIAEILGIEVNDLMEIKKENKNFEFSKLKKKLDINKIRKKRELIEKNQAKFDKFIDNNFKKWQKKILKAIREKIEKINNVSDLFNLSFNYDNSLEDMMLMSLIQGFDNAVIIDNEITEFSDAKVITRNAALDIFLKKHPSLYNDIENEIEHARQKNFWIKKVTDVNITEKIFKQMSNTLENGGTFKEWKKDVDNILSQSGLILSEGYLKTVFRTNINHAYNAGIYMKMNKYKDRYPYYQYCGTLDGREQEHTKELNGKIFEIGTAIADKYFPPNGFNCRCYTVSLTADEVNPSEVVTDGDISQDIGDFTGNIGTDKYIETLKKNYNEKVKSIEKIEKEVLQNIEKEGKIKKEEKFVEAKNIKEANKYAEDVLGIKADYRGVDIKCANEWNKGIFEMKQLFPEVTDKLKFVGSIQGRNQSIKRELTYYFKEEINSKYKGLYSEKLLESIVKENVDKILDLIKPKKNTMAVSLSLSKDVLINNPELKVVFEHNGISMNKNYFQDYEFVKMDKTEQVNEKWKPIGTNTVKGTFDHEFGHQLDKFLDLKNDKEIEKIHKQLTKENSFKEKLSGYSQKSKAEMIAEAWSEYRNNSEPREVAKKVGKRVEELWQQYQRKK